MLTSLERSLATPQGNTLRERPVRPVPDRPPPTNIPVYVPEAETDPVGHQIDADLAQHIREVEEEAGLSGEAAYEAGYRRMFALDPNDPVPPLRDMPWRRSGQAELDRLEGRPPRATPYGIEGSNHPRGPHGAAG